MLIRLYLALCAIALTGCAAQSVQRDYTLEQRPNEGIVVISVSHDRAVGRTSKAIFYLNGGVVGENGRHLTSVDEVLPGIPGRSELKDDIGRLLVLALPSGKHQFTSWQFTNGGVRLGPRQKPEPLSFEIAPGEVKYLGNLHGNMEKGKNIFGIRVLADGYPEVRNQQERDLAILGERFPQFREKVKIALLPLGPWISAELIDRQLAPQSAPQSGQETSR